VCTAIICVSAHYSYVFPADLCTRAPARYMFPTDVCTNPQFAVIAFQEASYPHSRSNLAPKAVSAEMQDIKPYHVKRLGMAVQVHPGMSLLHAPGFHA